MRGGTARLDAATSGTFVEDRTVNDTAVSSWFHAGLRTVELDSNIVTRGELTRRKLEAVGREVQIVQMEEPQRPSAAVPGSGTSPGYAFRLFRQSRASTSEYLALLALWTRVWMFAHMRKYCTV